MRHNSIPMQDVELLDVRTISPEISKCNVKVCYVGDEPNRNGSIITEEVARTSLAASLRGSPIVALYDPEKGDFLGHERDISVDDDGNLNLIDITRPYGFVDINAPIWFKTFEDDGVPHKYLMTEGYLWTGQYPEAKKIIEEGRGQSMELDDNLSGTWSKDDNGNPEFFIINEAIITKLCVLGEDVEPCFEGASVTKMQFSLDENFKAKMFEFMEEMRNILRKGDTTMEDNKDLNPEVAGAPADDEAAKLAAEEAAKKAAEEEAAKKKAEEDAAAAAAAQAEGAQEGASGEGSEGGEGAQGNGEGDDAGAAAGSAPAAYNLDDVVEYAELSTKYAELEATNATLNEKVSALENENAELKTFKLGIERKDKENMIASFYMLSEEDKANVKEHIDEYSLDEIEKELSVICVRNKVNFSLDNKEDKTAPATTFNLSAAPATSNLPAWLKEVDDVANNRK